MSNRYKWILVSTEMSLDEISETIHKHRFNENISDKGYMINHIDNSLVDAVFIERVIQHEKINRPDGTENEITIERFIYTPFIIYMNADGQLLIRFKNPPRTLNDFFSFWKKTFENNFFIEQLRIDILSLIASLSKSSFRDVKIKKIKASGMIVNITSSATIEVTSPLNALDIFLKEFRLTKFKLEHAKITSNFDGVQCSLDIKTTGLSSDNIEAVDFLEDKIFRNRVL
ncbi:hypothetical protein [Aeromonas salmonicida]|uniref:hypothetical protein n=1 Tax=Aeromonas salmonicida TaxID=645 RepID=UPI003D192660